MHLFMTKTNFFAVNSLKIIIIITGILLNGPKRIHIIQVDKRIVLSG